MGGAVRRDETPKSAPHPHVHCVVPGGGLSLDHSRWIRSAPRFFLPVRVLSRVFRGKFVAGLRRAFQRNQLQFFGECLPLAQEKNFLAFLRTLFQQDWVVYAKPPFGGPQHVLHYLARYRSEEHTSELQSRPHLVCR